MFPNSPGSPEQRGRLSSRLLRRLAVVAGCGLAAVAVPVVFADPPGRSGSAPVAASVPSASPDTLLARSAMAALDADPRLKDVTLLVSVVDRVAVIGGPVPSADHGRWAEERVRSVPGIADVKNHCFIQSRPDPLVRAVAGQLGPNPRPQTPDLPPAVPGLRPTTTASTDVAVGPTPNPGAPAAGPSGNSSTSLSPASDAGAFLLPPVSPGGSVPVPVAPAGANIPPPAPGVLTGGPQIPPVDPGRPESVLAAAEAVRRSDPRFAGLTVQLQGADLVIGGRAARASDAWDLSDALRRLPGVGRVVVGSVEIR
jgi:hypothetical protein